MLVASASAFAADSNWQNALKAVTEANQALASRIATASAQAGPPIRVGRFTVFRFRAPQGSRAVYLAGSFNAWAGNENGKVSNQKHLMSKNGEVWAVTRIVHGQAAYKFVVEDTAGNQVWVSDPGIKEKDKDGNSLINVEQLAATSLPKPEPKSQPKSTSLSLDRAWYRPGQTALVTIHGFKGRCKLQLFDTLGIHLSTKAVVVSKHDQTSSIDLPNRVGGYRLSANASGSTAEAVITVANNIASDLRYGFFANYPTARLDNDAKAQMLRDIGINAVEFYDYFPAHGRYAPTPGIYKSDPFGITLSGDDVIQKILVLRKCGVQSIAYVAAYAASRTVKDLVPDPMVDSRGVPKVFTGSILPEDEADNLKKDKWFYLMNIGAGSRWRQHILGEFGRTLDQSGPKAIAFDGLEMDTYGDSDSTTFYAHDTPDNGKPLRSVLQAFVNEVRERAHGVNPNALISFNSVNEFGADEMNPITDFAFYEIWRGYCNSLEGLADICFDRRGAKGQRVILKLYPADMRIARKSWPARILARIMGATMVGGGSLMVAGEPDPTASTMHGLNTLYYPDHQALSESASDVVREYNRLDALSYGWTHGDGVQNTELEAAIEDGFARTYLVPGRRAIVVAYLLHSGDQAWDREGKNAFPTTAKLTLALPREAAPAKILQLQPGQLAPTPVKFDSGKSTFCAQFKCTKPYGVFIFRYK